MTATPERREGPQTLPLEVIVVRGISHWALVLIEILTGALISAIFWSNWNIHYQSVGPFGSYTLYAYIPEGEAFHP